jgi:hypothetical protein
MAVASIGVGLYLFAADVDSVQEREMWKMERRKSFPDLWSAEECYKWELGCTERSEKIEIQL